MSSKYLKMQQFGAKLSGNNIELEAAIKKLFRDQNADDITGKQILDSLISFCNSTNDDTEIRLNTRIEELENDLKNKGLEISILREDELDKNIKTLDLELNIEELQKKCEELQNEANVNARLAQQYQFEADGKTLPENALILNVEPFLLEIIQLTAVRLSEKYNNTLSSSDIIADLTFRYLCEQNNQIAFPFMVSRKEIREIIEKKKGAQ